MRAWLPAALGLALLAGCRDRRPVAGGSPIDAAATASASARASTSAAASAPLAASASPSTSASAAPAAMGDPTRIEPRSPPSATDADTPVARAGERIFWAEPDGDASLVLGKVGAGPTRLLRRTSGKVGAIDVAEDDDQVVVAWASDLGGSRGQLVAIARASKDLARVRPAEKIAIVPTEIKQAGHVLVHRGGLGDFVVVHEGPPAKCNLPGWPPDTDCLTYDVESATATGAIERLGRGKLLGGPSPRFSIVDYPGAYVVMASSMRGGLTTDAIVVPSVADDKPPSIELPLCNGVADHVPELTQGTEGEVVALCIASAEPGARCARPLAGDRDRCLEVSVTGRDGRRRHAKRSAAVRAVSCDGSWPRVAFDGGAVSLSFEPRLTKDFVRCPR